MTERMKVHKDKITKRKLGLKRSHKVKAAKKGDDEFGMPIEQFNNKVNHEAEIDERYMNYDSESDKEEEISGIIVPKPKGIMLEYYNKVCNYIRNKGWIRQVDIRAHSGITNTIYMNRLRGVNEVDHHIGSKGLLWRRNGREYEYCLSK